MDKEAFHIALGEVENGTAQHGGIGTMKERTLHAVLKRYYEPDDSKHEVKIGSYIADIAGENGIIEIQTRYFYKLRKKLEYFLERSEVTVVYPIARIKHLRWIDPVTYEVSNARKSPKRGSFYDAFGELYSIKDLLFHPGLQLRLLLIDLTEYRYLNGWSRNGKRGSHRGERIPGELADELVIKSPRDMSVLVPGELAERFTVSDYAKAARITKRVAQKALNVLLYTGNVVRTGKRGREYEYMRGEIKP